MKILPTQLPGVLLIEPAHFGDDRGWFMESWNQTRFEATLRERGLAPPRPFVQDNHSCSRRGVVRGLHYQLQPYAQGKLVRVVQGAVYDVAVDIRPLSPTFGRWEGVVLSAANRLQLWIPVGFAHGFLALEDDTHFLYKTTDVYEKTSERAIRWNDPAIGIHWPIPEGMDEALVAPRDAAAPLLKDAELPAP
jgi:dTDP-4-dehydrorhamnose 3,5-epimerase